MVEVLQNSRRRGTQMWQLVKNEFERVVNDKLFYLAIMIGTAIMAVNIYYNVIGPSLILSMNVGKMNFMGNQIVNMYSAWLEMQQNQYGQLYYFVMPIVAALPYTMTLYSDVKNKYVNQLFTRTKKKLYYTAKLIVQFVTGGTIAVVPQVAALIISAMFLPCVAPQSSSSIYTFSELSVFGDFFYLYPLMYCIFQLIAQFVLFGLINLLAYVFSEILDNGFVVLIAPFAVYFLQFVICEMIGKASIRDNITIVALHKSNAIWILENILIIIFVIFLSYVYRIKRKDTL